MACTRGGKGVAGRRWVWAVVLLAAFAVLWPAQAQACDPPNVKKTVKPPATQPAQSSTQKGEPVDVYNGSVTASNIRGHLID